MIRSRGFLSAVRRKQVASTLFHGVVASLLLGATPALARTTTASSASIAHKSASTQRASSHRSTSTARKSAFHRRDRSFVRTVSFRPTSDENSIVDQGQADAIIGETLDRGTASWYDLKGNGPRTSSGERFDENAMTAAHTWLPLGTRVRVTVVGTNQSVVVTINDRQGATSRVIDLSKGAARELGIINRGTAKVILTRG